MDRSQCKNKFESKILFHHGEISFWRQKSGNIIDILEKTLKSRGQLSKQYGLR